MRIFFLLLIGWASITQGTTLDGGTLVKVTNYWDVGGITGITVGEQFSGNELQVLEGGVVSTLNSTEGHAWLGYTEGSSSNRIMVAGAGASVDLKKNMYVGYQGSENNLSIQGGGEVDNGKSYIGYLQSAHNNSVYVSGTNSVWRNREALYIGGGMETSGWVDGGLGNFLTVESNAWVSVGLQTNDLPSYRGGILVGDAFGEAELYIGNGSIVDSPAGYLGYAADEVGLVTVAGAGSEWDAGSLNVGYEGAGSVLRIEDGASVQATLVTVGSRSGAHGNRILVSGEGSSLKVEWPRFIVEPSWPGRSVQTGQALELIPVCGGIPVSSNIVPVAGSISVCSGLPLDSSSLTGGAGASGGNGLVSVLETASVLEVNQGLFVGNLGNTNSLLIGGGYLNTNVVLVQARQSFPGDLVVGDQGANNLLLIEDGGSVNSYRGLIGALSGADSNQVVVTDSGSLWSTSGDLRMGGDYFSTYDSATETWEESWQDGGRYNELSVQHGGRVTASGDLENRNFSTIRLGAGSEVRVGSDYDQDASSTLYFGVRTNEAGAPESGLLSVDGAAVFEEGASIEFASNVGLLSFGQFYTNTLVESEQLVIGGTSNASLAQLNMLNTSGSLVDVWFRTAEDNIYALTGRKYLSDVIEAEEGSNLFGMATEIDRLSLTEEAALAQLDILNGMSGAEQAAVLRQLYEAGTPTYEHAAGMLDGLSELRKRRRTVAKGAEAPVGAAGPEAANQELQGWIQGYGSWGDRDVSSGYSGYDHQVYGTIVGFEKGFGSTLLGVAGGYADSDLSVDNGDESRGKTGYGALYASWAKADHFADVNLSYGRSQIDWESGTVFDTTAETDADMYALYLGGGRDLYLAEGRVLLTPSAALTVSLFDQAGYTETSSTALARQVDDYQHWGVQTKMGLSAAMQPKAKGFSIAPELRCYWLRELNASEDQVGYTVGGSSFAFAVQAPERDLLEAGAGLKLGLGQAAELALDVDGRFGSRYNAYAVSGRLAVEF